MSYVRLALGVVIGLLLTSFLAEMIELGVVLLASGEPFAYLRDHQEQYFEIRNQPTILMAKMVYTLAAAAIGGWTAAKIAGRFDRAAICGLIALQAAALLWTGFFSELAATAPPWLWFALIAVTSTGYYFGYRSAERGSRLVH